MITEIRRRFKKYGFQVVLWITSAAMFITFLPTIFDPSRRQQVAATVNGYEISFPEYAMRLTHEQDRIAMFRERFGAQADLYLSMFGMDNPEKNAVDGLVQDVLLDQAAQQTHMAVDSDTIRRKILDPQFVMTHLLNVVPMHVIDPRTGTIHPGALDQYLAQKGIHQELFDASIERAIRSSTLMGLAATTVYIEPEELKDFYERTTLGRTYGIAKFGHDAYVKKAEAAGASDQQLQSFYQVENAKDNRYMIPEKRSGDIWQFSPAGFGVAITDEQAKAQYERTKHKQYIESPAQFQIRSILIARDPKEGVTDAVRERAYKVAELAKNDSAQFAQLAKEYSDDKNTASKGGLSDWMTREQLTPEVRRALFALKDDGAVSELIKSKDGFELIQRVARKPVQFKPFESVKSAIIARLERQQFNKEFEREARQAIRNAQGLEQFIKDKGGIKETIANAERGTDATVKALYTGKIGDYQATLSGDNGVIVHITKIDKKHEPAFEDIKSVVRKDYLAKQATELMNADLKKAVGLAQEMPIEQVARTLGATYQSTPFITQDNQAELQKLTKEGIPAERLLGLTRVGARETFMQGQNGFLAQVTGVEQFDQVQFDAKKEAIAQQLYQEEIARKQRSLVASLYRNATLKTSDQINLQPKA